MSLSDVLVRIEQLAPQPEPASPATQPATGTSQFADILAQQQRSVRTTSAPPTSELYQTEIDGAAKANGLDPALLVSVIQQESGFDPNATSAAGAQGLMQLMPATATALGVTDPYDPAQSIAAGARYLRSNLDSVGGNVSLALAAYNAGLGAVERFGGIPPYAETQRYVQQVLGRYATLTDGQGGQ